MHKLLTVPQVLGFLPACNLLSTITFPTTSVRIAIDLILPTKTHTANWGHTCQYQVNRVWLSNYSHSVLWDVVTYPCTICPLLAHVSWIEAVTIGIAVCGPLFPEKNDVSMYHGRGLSKGMSLSTIFTNEFYHREYGPDGHLKDCYPSTLP